MTYNQLLADIAAWSHRSDVAAMAPGFVRLAEERIARDLKLRAQIVYSTLAIAPQQMAAALPSDFIELDRGGVRLAGKRLDFVTKEQLGDVCQPAYSIDGQYLLVGPVSDDVQMVDITYYARFPALADVGENWLLTNHPSVYLNASLLEFSLWAEDDASAGKYGALYDKAVGPLQAQDRAANTAGSALRIRMR